MQRTRSLGLVVVAALTAGLTACANGQVEAGPVTASAVDAAGQPSTAPNGPPGKAATQTAAVPARSDLSQLQRAGIDVSAGVLIDVADDGVNRWLQVGKDGVVDFTGAAKDDSTMMSLQPAPVQEKNRVVIKPPFYNEDLGAGYCVADTADLPLKLEGCALGKASQIWRVDLAGDSGQFTLTGVHGTIRVKDGKISNAGGAREGLQTIPFAR